MPQYNNRKVIDIFARKKGIMMYCKSDKDIDDVDRLKTSILLPFVRISLCFRTRKLKFDDYKKTEWKYIFKFLVYYPLTDAV